MFLNFLVEGSMKVFIIVIAVILAVLVIISLCYLTLKFIRRCNNKECQSWHTVIEDVKNPQGRLEGKVKRCLICGERRLVEGRSTVINGEARQ